MECPQAAMMGNSTEGDLWMVEIQLMYAQHWPVATDQLSHHESNIQAQQQLLQQQILMSRGGGMGGGEALSSSGRDGVGTSEGMKRVEKSLRELLEEQDIGK